jgi:four helix bundle protein
MDYEWRVRLQKKIIMDLKENVLKDKSFAFAIRIAKLYKYLVEEKKDYVLSKQLLKCGTSIGANIREANNAESIGDFIHKLSIAQKETDETLYWLELIFAIESIDKAAFDSLYTDANTLFKIIRSSIITSKQKIKPTSKVIHNS